MNELKVEVEGMFSRSGWVVELPSKPPARTRRPRPARGMMSLMALNWVEQKNVGSMQWNQTTGMNGLIFRRICMTWWRDWCLWSQSLKWCFPQVCFWENTMLLNASGPTTRRLSMCSHGRTTCALRPGRASWGSGTRRSVKWDVSFSFMCDGSWKTMSHAGWSRWGWAWGLSI